jgi:hypothetical protein
MCTSNEGRVISKIQINIIFHHPSALITNIMEISWDCFPTDFSKIGDLFLIQHSDGGNHKINIFLQHGSITRALEELGDRATRGVTEAC